MLKSIWNRMHGLRCVYVLLFFLTLSHATSKLKSLNHKIDHVIHEIPTRRILGATKHTREKILNPQNTHKKTFRTYEIPTIKSFGPAKYPRKYYGTMALDPGHLRWHATHQILHNHQNLIQFAFLKK